VLSRSGVALPNSYSLSSTDPRCPAEPAVRCPARHTDFTSPPSMRSTQLLVDSQGFQGV